MSKPSILSAIQNRRSVFPNMYSDQSIEKAQIDAMLEASRWAPTHRKTQPWRYIVFHTEESRQLLANYLTETYANRFTGDQYSEIKHRKVGKKPMQSGGVIAIVMQRDPMQSVPEWEEVAAIGASVQNMLLVAHDMGLGAYWSSPTLITEGAENFLGLSEGQRCLGVVYVGHKKPVEFQSARKEVEDIASFR